MPRIRLPFLLYSYIATELLAPFFASFLILYGVFFLVRLIPLLEIVLELGINFPDFVRLFSYIFPHMLLYVISMSVMAGVIMGFTRLTNDREILGFKASGISLLQMLPPVVMVAAIIAGISGYFSVRLIPAGEIAMQQLMFQLAKEKIDKGIKEKKFTEALGDLVVYVDQVDEHDKWTGVFVSDMRNRQQPIITMAKSGSMTADVNEMAVTIVLKNGTLHSTDGPDNQIIHFVRYQLQIPLKPPTRIDGDDVTHIGRGAMTQAQLIQSAEAFKALPERSVKFMTEYHQRLVLPVGCFILAILGIPLGLQAGPGRKAAGIPLGLGFFVFYYITFTFCTSLVEELVLPVVLGMWLPNIIFAVITGLIFWRVEQEKSIFPEKLSSIYADIYDKCVAPLFMFSKNHLKILLSRRRKKSIQLPKDPSAVDETLIHADAHNRVFHLSPCEQYSCKRCTITFINPQVAEKAGFTPCPFCKELLKSEEKGS
ncbi:MAG: LPS export ABC transporter permease LptF [Desulfobulbus sp.]|nr:MAG: LPS export ABC transporter permease LptF [Desulfobulbus sp.]